MANPFDQFDEAPSGANPFDQFDTTPKTPNEAKGMKEAGESGQVYVKPLPGLSAKTTAALYSGAEAASSTVRGIAQGAQKLLREKAGVDVSPYLPESLQEKTITEQVKTRKALEKNPEYKKAALVGTVAGSIADPTNFVPLGAAKTVGQVAKQAAVAGGAGGFLGATDEEDSRIKNAALGAAAGGVGGAIVGGVLKKMGKLGTDQVTPSSLASADDEAKIAALRGTSVPKTETKVTADTTDAEINAKKIADRLISRGTPQHQVDKVVAKNPLVQKYLDEYTTKYAGLKESRIGEVKQGEVLPPETSLPTDLPKLPASGVGGSQGGGADTSLLTGVAAPAMGAVAGAAADREDPVEGALLGAAGGYGARKVLPKVFGEDLGKGAEKAIDITKEGTKSFFGQVGSNINAVHPEVGRAALNVERNKLEELGSTLRNSDPFVKHIETEMSAPVQEAVKHAWLNGKMGAIEGVLEGDALKAFQNMQESLQNVRTRATELGLLKGGIDDYLPRMVEDRAGLLEALGGRERGKLEEALYNKAKEMGLKDNNGKYNPDLLDEVTWSQIANKHMNLPEKGAKAGYRQSRSLQEVPEELAKFYHSPTVSYHTYMEKALSDIHTAEFFGKDLVKTPEGQIDSGASIGTLLKKLMDKGEIDYKGMEELSTNLNLLYSNGAKQHALASAWKELQTMTTLADPSSSLQNIGDLVFAPVVYGVKPALTATMMQLAGKSKLTTKEYGLLNHYSEEFVNTSGVKKVSDTVMKAMGWQMFDSLGKNVAFNSSLLRAQNWAKSEKGISRLEQRYGKAFGEDFPQLVSDLQQGKTSDLVKEMSFWDVAQHQPLTRLQRTGFATKHPNIAVGTHSFRSYVTSQLNYLRENAFREIKKGNVAVGMKTLMAGGLGIALSNVAANNVQNFILGRDFEFDADQFIKSGLKGVGFNEYTLKKFEEGKIKEGISQVVLPSFKQLETAYTKATEPEVISASQQERNTRAAMELLPGGRTVASQFMGGAEDYEQRKLKREMKEERSR